MKALPSIAFSDFKGTASDVTARHVGGRTVLNGRAQHSHIKTPKQSVRRANFSFITKQFRNLTDEQRKAWNKLAAAHREVVRFWTGEPLTGQNLFVCLNANRALLGVSLTTEAPQTVYGSEYIGYDDIWITPERLVITGLKDPEIADSQLVVKIAAVDSQSVTKAWGKTVVAGTFKTSDWGDIDLTEIYSKQFGVPIIVGHKYFLEMYWINENSGYVSEVTRVCSIAKESLSIHSNEYIGRERLKQTDLDLAEDNHVSDFNMEFTSGSPFLSVSSILEGIDGTSASYATIKEGVEIPYSDTRKSAYILVRGFEHRAPAVFWVDLQTPSFRGYTRIVFAWRAGEYAKPAETIGGGVMYKC